jgi:hypothetical protein
MLPQEKGIAITDHFCPSYLLIYFAIYCALFKLWTMLSITFEVVEFKPVPFSVLLVVTGLVFLFVSPL